MSTNTVTSNASNNPADYHRLAYWFAKRYKDTLGRPDANQAALLGLYEAHSRFNSALGVPFRAYAAKHIMLALRDAARNAGRTVTPKGRRAREIAPRVKGARKVLGFDATAYDIAAHLGASVAEIEEFFRAENLMQGVSYETILREGFEGDLPAFETTPEIETERKIMIARVRYLVDKYREKLSERDRTIVDGMLLKGPSARDVAQDAGCSHVTANNVAKKGRESLARLLREER
jgi:RNA polymerase sigma factor for flagellar operon FliA